MYYRKQEVKALIKNFLKKAAYRLTSKNFLKNIDMDLSLIHIYIELHSVTGEYDACRKVSGA